MELGRRGKGLGWDEDDLMEIQIQMLRERIGFDLPSLALPSCRGMPKPNR